MKLLKTIRLDPSDSFIFPSIAQDEWAVSGGFMFAESALETLQGKEKQAFRAGFVGVQTLGFSTLVEVQEGNKDEAIEALAQSILKRFHAPTLAHAKEAAAYELEQSMTLANHEIGTLIAMHRTFEGGEVHEIFRTLNKKVGGGEDPLHSQARAFTFHEVEEEIDFEALMKGKRNG